MDDRERALQALAQLDATEFVSVLHDELARRALPMEGYQGYLLPTFTSDRELSLAWVNITDFEDDATDSDYEAIENANIRFDAFDIPGLDSKWNHLTNSERAGYDATPTSDIVCSGCGVPLPTEGASARHFYIRDTRHLNLGNCPTSDRKPAWG